MANDYILEEMQKARDFSDKEIEYFEKKYVSPFLKVGEGREVPKDKFLDDQEMQQEGEEAERDSYES